jgi:hypothetical protein
VVFAPLAAPPEVSTRLLLAPLLVNTAMVPKRLIWENVAVDDWHVPDFTHSLATSLTKVQGRLGAQHSGSG